jgi:hypothetical protein
MSKKEIDMDDQQEFRFRRAGSVFYMDADEKVYTFNGGSGLIHFPSQTEARLVAAYMDSSSATVTTRSFDMTLDEAERWLEFFTPENTLSHVEEL